MLSLPVPEHFLECRVLSLCRCIIASPNPSFLITLFCRVSVEHRPRVEIALESGYLLRMSFTKRNYVKSSKEALSVLTGVNVSQMSL